MKNSIEFRIAMDEKMLRHLKLVHKLNLFPQQKKNGTKRKDRKREFITMLMC